MAAANQRPRGANHSKPRGSHSAIRGDSLLTRFALLVVGHPSRSVVVAALIAHAGALGAVFYQDDLRLIEPLSAQHASTFGVDQPHFLARDVTNFRMVTMLTLWLNHYLTGLSSIGFHVGNWLLHAAAALVLYWAGRDLLKRFDQLPEPFSADGVALAGALLFAVHPLGSEITHYVRARDTLLMTIFALGSAVHLSRFQGNNFAALAKAGGLALLASYSKPTGPLWVAGLLAWTSGCFWSRTTWKKSLRHQGLWWTTGGMFVAGLAWPGMPLVTIVKFFAERAASFLAAPDLLSRTFITQLQAVSKLGRLLIWPSDLVSDHYTFYFTSWTDPRVVFTLVGLGVVMAAGWWAWRRGWRLPVWALGVALGSQLLHCVYVTGEIYAEYRAYPSLAAFSLLAAWGTARIAAARRWSRQACAVAWTMVLVACTTGTMVRSVAWTSLERLSADVLETYPWHVRAHYHGMLTALERDDHQAVLRHREAMEQVLPRIQKFNRTAMYGRTYNWPKAVFFAVLAESTAARSIARHDGLEPALRHMQLLRENLDRQPFASAELIDHGYDHGLAMVYAEVGRYDQAWERLAPHVPFDEDFLQREVESIVRRAAAAGRDFPPKYPASPADKDRRE